MATTRHPTPLANLALIAALARDRIIGRDNQMPWHLPEDLKRFKQLTLGAPVIMGRKTFESITATLGKPLPGRRNIVISGRADYAYPGVEIADSLDRALALIDPGVPSFVIGGGKIYAQALPLAARLHLTEIDADFSGDTRFPAFDRSQWREVARGWHQSASGPVPLRYAFVDYERR